MKHRTVTPTFAVARQFFIVGSIVAMAFLLPTGCGLPWQDTVHTADELAVAFCHHWVAQNPDKGVSDAVCTLGGDVFNAIVALMDAKKAPADIKEALIASPPIPTAMPCIQPHIEPQARIDRKLYPMIVEGPHGD